MSKLICRYCGYEKPWALQRGRKFMIGVIGDYAACWPCHLAYEPKVEYLLDCLAISQWEDSLCEKQAQYDNPSPIDIC